MVSLLLKHNADVMAYDKENATPRPRAAVSGNQGIIEVLIKAEYHLRATDKQGFIPSQTALTNRHQTISSRLRYPRQVFRIPAPPGRYLPTRLGYSSANGEKRKSEIDALGIGESGVVEIEILIITRFRISVELLH